MTKVLSLLGLGAVLAIVKALVVALALGALMAALICLARWPRETVAFSGVLILGGLASARPGVALLAFAAAMVGLAALGHARVRKKRRPRLQQGSGR